MIATVNLKWIVDKDDTKNTMLKYEDRSNPRERDLEDPSFSVASLHILL